MEDVAHPVELFDVLRELLQNTSGPDQEAVKAWFRSSLEVRTLLEVSKKCKHV